MSPAGGNQRRGRKGKNGSALRRLLILVGCVAGATGLFLTGVAAGIWLHAPAPEAATRRGPQTGAAGVRATGAGGGGPIGGGFVGGGDLAASLAGHAAGGPAAIPGARAGAAANRVPFGAAARWPAADRHRDRRHGSQRADAVTAP